MKKKIKKVTLREAEGKDLAYWRTKTPEEKLDALQQLRELYYDLNNESRKGFQRVYRIRKLKQSSGRMQDLADIEKLEKI